MKAEESTIGTLQINGQAELKNCVIKNTTTVNGTIKGENTKFLQNVSIASQKIVLTMCNIESLTVRKVSGYDGVQIIDLRNGTKVEGAISVESGNGVIWISSDSEISENQIYGAQVQRK